MATFSDITVNVTGGGETFIQTLSLNFNVTGATGPGGDIVLYTVPADRYAKINFHELSTSSPGNVPMQIKDGGGVVYITLIDPADDFNDAKPYLGSSISKLQDATSDDHEYTPLEANPNITLETGFQIIINAAAAVSINYVLKAHVTEFDKTP